MSLPIHQFLEGMSPGNLWIHASQPGHGNTSFLLSCCRYWQKQRLQVTLALAPGFYERDIELGNMNLIGINSLRFNLPQNTDVLAIDNFHLLERYPRTLTHTDHVNTLARDLKRIAITPRAAGPIPEDPGMIRVIATTQVTRNAARTAEENNGKYSLSSLAASNEIERSADIITAGFLSKAPWDQKDTGLRLLKLQFLKAREWELPESGFLELDSHRHVINF